MLKIPPEVPHLGMFKTILTSLINPQPEPCVLAQKINRESLKKEFAPLCRGPGRTSVPIRTDIALLLLKQIYSPGMRR